MPVDGEREDKGKPGNSHIQALDRAGPGLPIRPGKRATMTHGYILNGSTRSFLPSSASAASKTSDAC